MHDGLLLYRRLVLRVAEGFALAGSAPRIGWQLARRIVYTAATVDGNR